MLRFCFWSSDRTTEGEGWGEGRGGSERGREGGTLTLSAITGSGLGTIRIGKEFCGLHFTQEHVHHE